jgi:glycosyltransferase involved in cell wall biosynthesis
VAVPAEPSGSASPAVSVVVPTARRPELVVDAARSVLAQTMADLELIVVVDGRDDRTAVALAKLADRRLKTITLDPARGGNAARNAGVAAAAAPLVALLDDDDTWSPEHLQSLLAAVPAGQRPWCLFSRFTAVTAMGQETWPRRLKPPSEQVADYLFDRRRLFHGEALLHPSTMLCPRHLVLTHPFDETLRRHQDWDWLIRTEQATDMSIRVLPEVLAQVRVQDGRQRSGFPVEEQLDWIESIRPLISRRAYSGYYLTQIGVRSSATRDRPLGRLALRRAFRFGRPRVRHLAVFVALWLVPPNVRRRIRTIVSRS